ncbi:MAG: pilus assembly protein PilM [Bacillota bacterium]
MPLLRSSTLHLDIRETLVRAVRGSISGSAARLDGFATLELPTPFGRGGDEQHARDQGRRLAEFLDSSGLRDRRAVLGIGREGIITRTTRVPALAPKLLSEFLQREISEFLPVDLSEYNYDYRVMQGFVDESDKRAYYNLLLAAVPRYQVEQAMWMADEARLHVTAIDILPNALLRLFGQAPYNDVAVLDVGPSGTHVAIFKKETMVLYSDIPFRLTGVDEDFSILIEETRGYLNFFASRHQGRLVDALHLVGDFASLEAPLAELFSQSLGVVVKVGLDDAIRFQYLGKAGPRFSELSTAYASNLGLMLRED